MFPFYLVGHTFSSEGEIVGECSIVITDLTTGATNTTTVSDPVTGFYICDINNGLAGGVAVGDVISATATRGEAVGTNQTLLRSPLGSFVQMNITLLGEVDIPEFGGALLPIVGVIGVIIAAASVRARKSP